MRARVVTRTIRIRKLRVVALDTETNEVFETTLETGERGSAEKIIARLNKRAGGNSRYLHVLSESFEDIKFIMSEEDFIKLAKKDKPVNPLEPALICRKSKVDGNENNCSE